MNTLSAHFAASFAKTEVLDLLIEIGDISIDEALALNSHLTSSQITKMFNKTEQLNKIKGGYNRSTAILLALRTDLTQEHVRNCIESKNAAVRHALLVNRQEAATAIDGDLLTYILTRKNWYKTEHLRMLYHSPLSRKAGIRAQIKNAYIKQVSRNSQKPQTIQKARKALLDSYPRVTDSSIAYYEELISSIVAESLYNAAGMWLNKTDLTLAVKDTPIGTLTKKILSMPAKDLQNFYLFFREDIAQAVEGAIGEVGVNYYQMFFKLLPDWEGSVLELVKTIHTLDL